MISKIAGKFILPAIVLSYNIEEPGYAHTVSAIGGTVTLSLKCFLSGKIQMLKK